MSRSRCLWPALFLFLALSIVLADEDADASKADWWSFQPARRYSVPTPDDKWIRTPVDAFILAKLRTQGLSPSPEADRRTLIRRLTFDLIGLPPTPEEVSSFLRDTEATAYEKVVDRLLASPRYGERWARHWLDTVHYGESHGYDKDKPRLNAWRYRDYVIEAFNRDKPYGRFVEEQLAADVLFPDNPELVPALGFIAAGPWDFVGHVELPITKMDGLLARYNDRDDMVMNTMSTFQSLTVHCARCHDHKFDPISLRDYYGLQAVFAGVDRADRVFDADRQVAQERRKLATRLASLMVERNRISNEVARSGGEELRGIEERIAEQKRRPAKSASFGYHSEISTTQNAVKWVQVDLGEPREIASIGLVGSHDDFNNIGAGFGFPPRYKIEVSDDANFKLGVTPIADQTHEDTPNPGVTLQTIEVCRCLTDDGSLVKARYVRVTATKLAPRKNDYIFALGELMVMGPDGSNFARTGSVNALDSIESGPRWRKQNIIDGDYVGAKTNAPGERSLVELERERRDILDRLPESLRHRVTVNERDIKATRESIASLPKPQLVYAAANEFPPNGSFLPARAPRPVHLLKRGDVKRPGEEMKPAALGTNGVFDLPETHNEGLRRAALAKWITAPQNMLTRRSIVNRVWHYHFGRGLVDTPNDFGRMGSLPTHPELLDWLSFWFVDNGESIKRLHRLIVTSATYRQTSGMQLSSSVQKSAQSAVEPSGTSPAQIDTANRHLWRMNRSRLDAEQVRDAVLAISGRLDLTTGGPSVQQFHFKDDHSPVYDYARYDPDSPGASRRSIYRFIVRSVPDPLMETLDCPDANLLAPTRTVTMTALQALALLNDAFVLRQCEHFADRLVREQASLDEQIIEAYEWALARRPTEAERVKLAAHARTHGLASACRVLFNSNEFLFID